MTQRDESFQRGSKPKRALQLVQAASLTLRLCEPAALTVLEVTMAGNDAAGLSTNFSKRDAAQTPGVLQQGHALILGSTSD